MNCAIMDEAEDKAQIECEIKQADKLKKQAVANVH
jgi:hypothetical protein